MPIVPDTKNWTWVLERPCPECSYNAAELTGPEVAGQVRANAARWPAVLERADVRDRPDEHTWSPLEYAAHVRDVLRITRERLALMLGDDNPTYANWDQDATALADRYDLMDPSEVSILLQGEAESLAADVENVNGELWQRNGRRSDGALFTVDTFARYVLHDIVHHIHDVKG